MTAWPPPTYKIEADLRAPLEYVYRWCTDFRSDDARITGEDYERRIISRSRRKIVLEDLWWESDGWRWRRSEIALHPPDRWFSVSLGNVRDAEIDYRLSALSDGATRLTLTMRRRPTRRFPQQPSKRSFEAGLRADWKGFARALEADYRTSRRKRGR